MKKMAAYLLLSAIFLAGCGSGAGSASGEPPPIVETGIDPDAWVRIPAGEFLLGLHEHETLVEYDYEAMVTDVTNAQYARYLNEALAAGSIEIVDDQVMGYYPGDEFHAHEHEEEIPAGNYVHLPLDDEGLRLDFDGQNFTPKTGYENHPMVLVSWFGAKAYCEFYGWRLPSEIEWEKAARGGDARPFPWGDEIARNNANYYSSHDVFEKIWGGAGGTTPVGFYNGKTYDGYETLDSPSPYGLYDMAGNVWQWTNDVYENQHYRYMRGGSKENYGYNLRVWTRNSAGPSYYSPSVGFRCARGG
jgi:formylglycine-generating enzyme required for sulfatase activity